jgi:ubiquinone/menaquinone biosynthesis C-methylase UbiE
MSAKKQSPRYEADSYERYRASYPVALATKLFEATNYKPPATILEIGCGTGKGTEILIEHGASVHAVEPLSAMGLVAQKKFPRSHFSWTNCAFEDYQDTNRLFPLITSAQAFHWVDQEVAFSKCHRILEPGGALAVYRNNRRLDDEFSQREHQLYVKYSGAEPHGSWNENYYEALAECVTDFIKYSRGRFHRPQVHEFDHVVSYTTESYIGLQNTFFADALEHPQLPRILEETAKLIDSMGGKIEFPYTAVLYVLFKK